MPKLDNAPKTAKRHIVHGVLSLDLGGLERLVLDLVKIGVRQGDWVTVVCIERPGKLAEAAREFGAGVITLNKPPGRSALAVEQATRLLANLRPDVLHTHQIGALWYLGQAAARTGLGCVVHTEHSDHVRQAKTWRDKLRARYLWWQAGRLAKRFCCVSADVSVAVRRWGTVPAGRVAVVPNGIDTDLYASDARAQESGDGEQVVGTVGRLAEVKQQHLMVRAVAALAQEFPALRLLLIGDGPERDPLEALAASLKVSNRIEFAGYQEHPERFLPKMNIFALTSRHEALPLSLLEAWASRLPVVSSAVGGIPQVVEHGRTGLLFPSGNLNAFVAELRKVLQNNRLAGTLAEQGRAEVVAKYSLQRMIANYEEQYAAAVRK